MYRYISSLFSFHILQFNCCICTYQLQLAINTFLFVEYPPEDGQHKSIIHRMITKHGI